MIDPLPSSAVITGAVFTSLLGTIALGIAAKREGTCAKWWYPAATYILVLVAAAIFIAFVFSTAYALTWLGVFK